MFIFIIIYISSISYISQWFQEPHFRELERHVPTYLVSVSLAISSDKVN